MIICQLKYIFVRWSSQFCLLTSPQVLPSTHRLVLQPLGPLGQFHPLFYHPALFWARDKYELRLNLFLNIIFLIKINSSMNNEAKGIITCQYTIILQMVWTIKAFQVLCGQLQRSGLRRKKQLYSARRSCKIPVSECGPDLITASKTLFIVVWEST